MEYATRVIQFPLGAVGLAVSFAILPTLSRFSDGGPTANLAEYRDALVFGLRLVLLPMLLALAVFAALAVPDWLGTARGLIAILFERGAFEPKDTTRTAAIFLAYSPMLPLTAVDLLLINAFYARQNPRTPVLVGVVCVVLYLGVALSLIGPLGAVGLALANAVQNSSHALILLILLQRSLPGMRLGSALLPFLARTVPAAGVAGFVLLAIWPWLAGLGGLGALVVGGALAGLIYAALVLALGVSEARDLLLMVRARLSA
jgi:putative peptidoglycan lipid II flippase